MEKRGEVLRKSLFCKAIVLAWDLVEVVLRMLQELGETPSEARTKVIEAQVLFADGLQLLEEAHKDVWA